MSDEKKEVKKTIENIAPQTTPIQIDDTKKLMFENLKLKIDMCGVKKQMLEQELNILSEQVNRDIVSVMEEMKIPNYYKLDFNTFEFIVPA